MGKVSTQGTSCSPTYSLTTECISVHPPTHLLMIHEVSLQEAASQRHTRSLKWIGSQESCGNWPGRVSWSMLGQRAKHELTLLLIIARTCTALRGFTVYNNIPSESSHGSSQKPMDRQDRNHQLALEVKNHREAQRR